MTTPNPPTAKVIRLRTTTTDGRKIEPKDATVTIRTLNMDGRRLTRAIFNQIPVARLEQWPPKRFGWVMGPGTTWTERKAVATRWLVYVDERGRLARANVTNWTTTDRETGETTPATDDETQIYI